MATYTFFSSDGKFVPLCKLCNESAYTVTRDKYCKIVCSNLKCKIKILAEYYETEKHLKNDNLIITEKSEISSKKSSISRSSKTINAERKYTK